MIKRALFNWIASGLSRYEGIQNPDMAAPLAASTVPVTFDNAMQLSAWWSGTRLLSETVASLRLEFWKEGQGEERIPLDNDVTDLFKGKVNRYQTRFEFMETMMLNLVSRGNCYALKQKVGNRLVGLVPLMAAQTETELLDDGSIVHHYYSQDGVKTYSSDSVWHVKLFGNGIVGLSPLSYAASALGIAMAGEKRTGEIFRNGGKPSGVLMIDKLLNKQQREQIRERFRELREGNTDRLMVLEASMKYEQISMSPEDIELLSSRRFSIEDLARFLGVPSVLINDTQGSTVWGSGIEQIINGFEKLNLRPYFERFEGSIIENLMPMNDRARARVMFNLDSLKRLDRNERATANQTEINSGSLLINEARASEGRPPVPGGDIPMVNSTMIPINQAGTSDPVANALIKMGWKPPEAA